MDIKTNPRTIIITGALRGLGFELSKILVREAEYQVILTSRNPEKSQKALDELKASNPACKIDYHILDISDKESIKEFSEWVQKTYGKFDVLVNNAAVIDIQWKEASLGEQAQRVLETNLYSTMRVTEALSPHLSQDGKILLISSDDGKLFRHEQSIRDTLNKPMTKDQLVQITEEYIQMRRDQKLVGWNEYCDTSYAVSKVLLNAYGRWVVTQEIGANQSVFLVDPGWCKTDMGTDKAPFEPVHGTICMLHLIKQIPFGKDPKFNGQYFDDMGGLYEQF